MTDVPMHGARLEDLRLLTGRGRFVADQRRQEEARAVFVRSPHAHARIGGIDTAAALAMPGVLAILTAADLAASGIGGLPWDVRPPGSPVAGADGLPDGAPEIAAPHPLLADGRVLYAGQIVAMVIAETSHQALDAAESVVVNWQALPAVVDLADAVAEGTPALWPQAPGNVCFTLRKGNAAAVDAALAAARHVVHLRLRNNRLTANPIEPRGYLGHFDAPTGRYTLLTQSGSPHTVKRTLARHVLRVPPERLRVVVDDVGGGFGMKNAVYVEEALVLVGAARVGRPVRWTGERGECVLSDMAGRDQLSDVTLGLDADGRFVALRVRTLANLGAFLGGRGVISPTNAARVVSGCYRIPAIDLEVRGIHTHTVPTAPYRGAGQPEQVYLLERIVDRAAWVMGLDRVDLRRRNLLHPADLPYETPCGIRYDEGDYGAVLEAAVAKADWSGFAARSERSRRRGYLRGMGLALCLETKAMDSEESAVVHLDGDGRADIMVGTISSGQGHETAYARLVADRFGIPLSMIALVQGDTDRIAKGGGTAASRSLTIGGSAIALAADALIEQARERAADFLEAAVSDIVCEQGACRVVGTDRRVTLTDLAVESPLAGEAVWMPENFAFPYGCHVAEVEVDPQTGACEILSYVLVQDVGRALNPAIVDGQLQGGLAQGIGQALLEHLALDSATGQVLAGSFMDYAMPRADDLPSFTTVIRENPSRGNPLGVRPIGETGPTGAPPAIVNAILHAIGPDEVDSLDMPATPWRVWQAIRGKSRQRPGS